MAKKRRTGRIAELFDRFSEPLAHVRQSVKPEPVQVERVHFNINEEHESAREHVSWPLQVAAAWSWRILIVILGLVVIGYGLSFVTVILIPILIALLFAVLLDPVNRFLQRRMGLPPAAGAAISLLLGLGLVIGLVSAASSQIFAQFGDLVAKASDGLNSLVTWVTDGPLQLPVDSVEEYLSSFSNEFVGFLQSNSQSLASGAMSITITVGNVLTGFFLAMFVLFFFLKDGRKIWLWFVRMMPQGVRVPVHESAVRGWVTLGAYARTQILVAAIDGVGIGLGAFFLGVPLAIPLAVLVFVGSFVPIVGAFVTGSIAVLVALVDQGMMTALLMLIVILVVQQVEGNLLQPLLMSNAVSLHPVAVLLAVAAGSFLFGIPGALFSVPVVAFVNTSVLYLYGYDKFPELSTRSDRPGGPPGTLDEQILGTYAANVRRVNPEVEPTGNDSDSEGSGEAVSGEAGAAKGGQSISGDAGKSVSGEAAQTVAGEASKAGSAEAGSNGAGQTVSVSIKAEGGAEETAAKEVAVDIEPGAEQGHDELSGDSEASTDDGESSEKA